MSPLHVVVIGHGMVGARFAEEVRRQDPAGRRVRLTILTAEPRPGYNRVLLPSLLSGAMAEEDFRPGPAWASAPADGVPPPADRAMTLRTSAAVTGIDPASRTVTVRAPAEPRPAETTETIRYDALVLATGGRAVVPPLPGLRAGEAGHPGTMNARPPVRAMARVRTQPAPVPYPDWPLMSRCCARSPTRAGSLPSRGPPGGRAGGSRCSAAGCSGWRRRGRWPRGAPW